MNEFIKYSKSLPEMLDDKEQEILLYEYAKTKDENIREKLINHNLRLCAIFAIKHCQKYNIFHRIEEVYSDAIIGLIEAIENNIANEGNFKSFAYGCMFNIVRNAYVKQSEDALFNVVTTKVIDDENEDIWFNELFDEKESNFTEEISGKLLVEDVLEFINTWKNKTYAEIIKMYCGIDGYTPHTQVEISKILNIGKAHVSNYLSFGKTLIKNYLTEKYPHTFTSITKDIAIKKEFASIQERNDYIIKRFFGIGCERLDSGQLSEELSLKPSCIQGVVSRYKKSLSEGEKDNFKTPSRNKKYDDDFNQKLFDAYYGINGNKPHNPKDIIALFNLNMTNDSCYNKINAIKREMISSGKYTIEDMEEMDKNRRIELERIRMEKYAYSYYSFYGLEGYEQKSILQLSKELRVDVKTVRKNIELYQAYILAKETSEMAD